MNKVKSFYNKKWIINKETPSKEFLDYCQDELLAKFLCSQGIKTIKDASYYINPDSIVESSPNEILGMASAVNRIEEALIKNEKIYIYGDYDVDGTTSTALLKSTLDFLGADCSFYIPDRLNEGYGLNNSAIVKIKSKGKAKLLISCDCGISNIAEVKLARSLGLDVIITDHHSLPDELPPANAILNPKMLDPTHPLYNLPGVGTAYKLAQALLEKFNKTEEKEKLLDFVALGMIADLVPLTAENRILVKKGLKVLSSTKRIGLQCLLKECGYSSDEEAVGFAIGPRINAAGRLADASDCVELFLCDNQERAIELSKDLSEKNRQRQEICDEIFLSAVKKLEETNNFNELKVIMLEDESWHHGVIGIVASRLVEKYHLPVFLGMLENGLVKGSARGISQIDIFQEMNKFKDLFERFGGHKAAGGFLLKQENWEKLKLCLQEELKNKLGEETLEAELYINEEIEFFEFSLDRLSKILNLAPFGMGFSKPIFTFKEKVKILNINSLGKDKAHVKINININEKSIDALSWRTNIEEINNLKIGDELQIAFNVSLDKFNNLQIILKDWIKIVHREISTTEFLKILWKFCCLFPEKHFEVKIQELEEKLNFKRNTFLQGFEVLQKSQILKYEIIKDLLKVQILNSKPQTKIDTTLLKKELEKEKQALF